MSRKEYRAKMRAKHGPDWWKKKPKKAHPARRKTGFAASPKKKAWNEGWPTILGMKPYSAQDSVAYDDSRYGVGQLDLYVHKEGSKYVVILHDSGPGSDSYVHQEEVSDLTKKQAVETLKRLAAETFEGWKPERKKSSAKRSDAKVAFRQRPRRKPKVASRGKALDATYWKKEAQKEGVPMHSIRASHAHFRSGDPVIVKGASYPIVSAGIFSGPLPNERYFKPSDAGVRFWAVWTNTDPTTEAPYTKIRHPRNLSEYMREVALTLQRSWAEEAGTLEDVSPGGQFYSSYLKDLKSRRKAAQQAWKKFERRRKR